MRHAHGSSERSERRRKCERRRALSSCIRRLVPTGIALAALLVPGTASACSWPTKSDLDTTNVAFPDEGATYWVTRYKGVPGAEIVIRGRYPDARYFSFHIYDEALRPVASVADFETTPDGNGGYTAGFTFDAPESGALIYRVYVSGVPDDPAGGVPLPDISLKVAGREEELALGQCEPLPPSTGGALNDAIRESNYPAQAPRGFDIAMTDPEDRPANATNWLPWGGPYYDGLVLYRHMLPAPDFAEAIQNVPEGTPAADVMGDYFPRVAYCSKERFEAGGAAACLA